LAVHGLDVGHELACSRAGAGAGGARGRGGVL